MNVPGAFDVPTRRLAVYTYVAPLVGERRILEVGCQTGGGTARLVALGAAHVVATDDDQAALAAARGRVTSGRVAFRWGADPAALGSLGPFDVIVIADALGPLRAGGAQGLMAWATLLAPGGRLVCLVESADAPGAGRGLSYDDVVSALAPHFARVRMYGVTPFHAFGVAEFDETVGGLRVEAGLVDAAGEAPSHYLAIAGPDEPLSLGYALVQVPSTEAPLPTGDHAAPSPGGAATPDVADLRRRLADAQGQAEGALRVSRAQADEIDELRARLRRAAEARADLDAELARMRRALAEADESVVTLTRRTTEEMTALAQRITAGLRAGLPPSEPPARDESASTTLAEALRRREAELAARESALSERDERIAALEGEKQDLLWKTQELEARIEETERRLSASQPSGAPAAPGAGGAREEELVILLRGRDQALEQYRLAALAHLDEVTRLREALGEQSTLVAELEESLSSLRGKESTLEQENARLKRQAVEIEAADRTRRSRLAELEGTLLRLQRQAATAATAPPKNHAEREALARAERRVAELTAEVTSLRDQVRGAEARAVEAESRWGDAVEKMVGGGEPGAVSGAPPSAEHDLQALQARLEELEAAAAAAGGARLEAALRDRDRLRAALDRVEEQLWEAKGQLLLERERVAVLERQLAARGVTGPTAPRAMISEAAHRSIMETVLRELDEIETALRAEVAELAALERRLTERPPAVATTDDARV